MEKKDNGRINDTGDDMSIEELLRGLSEVSSSEKKEPAPTVESDPEIEELLKKYITESEAEKAEDIPVMEAPDYDGDESYAEEEPAPVRSMRFRIKSHTRNGVELVHRNVASEAAAAVAVDMLADAVIAEVAKEPQPEISQPISEEIPEPLVEEPEEDIILEDTVSADESAFGDESSAEEEIEPAPVEEFDGNISFDELEMTGDIPVVIPVESEPETEEEVEEQPEAVVNDTPADEYADAYSDEQ
ncbi:MAG: hypothetical protein IJF13_09975, partial [Clostridia bacterium]|nr:hypothetical protein [Clostridia bacterium]